MHRKLGRFCSERQYCDEIENEFKIGNYPYKREFQINELDESSPKGNRVDFLVDDKIIVEVKAKKFVTKEDYIQLLRYLKGAGVGLGLIVNFRSTYLKPKRVINSKFNSDNSGVYSSYSGR